jgi:hypothetical protein
MPARSKVAMLPDELRTELERRMAERAFSGYQELAEWLQSEGYPISDDSVQRHGFKHQRKLEVLDFAAHQARAITQAGYDADIVSDGMARLLQVQLFSLLFEAEQLELNDIVRLTRTFAQLDHLRQAAAARPRHEQQEHVAQPHTTTDHKMLPELDSQKIRDASAGQAFAPATGAAPSNHSTAVSNRSSALSAPASPNHTNSAEPAKPAAPVARPAPLPVEIGTARSKMQLAAAPAMHPAAPESLPPTRGRLGAGSPGDLPFSEQRDARPLIEGPSPRFNREYPQHCTQRAAAPRKCARIASCQ